MTRCNLPELEPREWKSITGNRWCCPTKEGEDHVTPCARAPFACMVRGCGQPADSSFIRQPLCALHRAEAAKGAVLPPAEGRYARAFQFQPPAYLDSLRGARLQQEPGGPPRGPLCRCGSAVQFVAPFGVPQYARCAASYFHMWKDCSGFVQVGDEHGVRMGEGVAFLRWIDLTREYLARGGELPLCSPPLTGELLPTPLCSCGGIVTYSFAGLARCMVTQFLLWTEDSGFTPITDRIGQAHRVRDLYGFLQWLNQQRMQAPR